jgi:GNAT superfamily N-acetyltransferase
MKWSISQLSRTLPSLIVNGGTGEIVRELGNRFYSNERWYLLRRDLSLPFIPPRPPKIPIRIRRLEKADIPRIIQERPIRRPALQAGLATCYLAVTDHDDICYMQWLIDSSQDELIEREFAGLCPRLGPDEMLLEWAYTFKTYRGLGIMAPAMAAISEEGARKGARWLMTFVEESNIPSLRGCRSAGYRPYKIREDRWWLYRCDETLIRLPGDAQYPFE